MLIGFAAEESLSSDSVPETDRLHRLGCERIFSPAQGVFSVDDVIAYLRPGDILVVTDLLRLGSDLERIVLMTERLHKEGIRLHVAGTDIAPNTALGETFVMACSMLSEFARTRKSERASDRGRSRGRPVALQPDKQVRAERLLKDGTSVAEIARLLNVSAATVYRYFPRRSQAEKEKTVMTVPTRRQRARPSKR